MPFRFLPLRMSGGAASQRGARVNGNRCHCKTRRRIGRFTTPGSSASLISTPPSAGGRSSTRTLRRRARAVRPMYLYPRESLQPISSVHPPSAVTYLEPRR